jgi:hypothetical protein
MNPTQRTARPSISAMVWSISRPDHIESLFMIASRNFTGW